MLEWSANEGRVLLTHDISTVVGLAFERVVPGKPMTGVVAVPARLSTGVVVDDVLLLAIAGAGSEWDGRVVFLPLR